MTFPTDTFGNTLQYVFHINSSSAYGEAQTETLVMCTFEARDNISCYVGTAAGGTPTASVTGDPSDSATPLENADQSLRVFAGTRADPFYFNEVGFGLVASTVHTNAGALTFDANSCPNNIDDLGAGTTVGLVTQLGEGMNGAAAVDGFEGNVDYLVVQVNKDLINGGGPMLGIWGSTRMR